MIVELIVGAGLVFAGAATARTLLRRREQLEEEEAAADAQKASDGEVANAKRKKKRAPVDAGPRGLRIGDVLLYGDTELWLAGMLQLDEEGFVMRLFPTPGALRAEWVAQLDAEARDVATLETTDEVPDGVVPTELPIGGRRLTLERRGQADVHADGEHLPRTTTRASYTLLSDAGGRVLIVVDFDKAARIALCGDRVAKHMLDLLPGGDLERDGT